MTRYFGPACPPYETPPVSAEAPPRTAGHYYTAGVDGAPVLPVSLVPHLSGYGGLGGVRLSKRNIPAFVPDDVVRLFQENKAIADMLGTVSATISPLLAGSGVLATSGVALEAVSTMSKTLAYDRDFSGSFRERMAQAASGCKVTAVVVGLFGTGGMFASVVGAEFAPVATIFGVAYAGLATIFEPLSQGKAPSVASILAIGASMGSLAMLGVGQTSQAEWERIFAPVEQIAQAADTPQGKAALREIRKVAPKAVNTAAVPTKQGRVPTPAPGPGTSLARPPGLPPGFRFRPKAPSTAYASAAPGGSGALLPVLAFGGAALLAVVLLGRRKKRKT